MASSQTVRSITSIKSNELGKKRDAFLRKEKAIEEAAERDGDLLSGTNSFARQVNNLHLPTADPIRVSNIQRFAKQAKYDTSVGRDELFGYGGVLRSSLETQGRQLEYATLYSAIIKEHLDSVGQQPNLTPQSEVPLEEGSLDGAFEMLQENRLQQLREKFERVVFNPIEIDETRLTQYLTSLFDTEHHWKRLVGMKARLYKETEELFAEENPFNDSTLQLSVKGLLKGVLISEEKKCFLETILNDSLLQEEICDVLNMRWADLDDWTWVEGNSGVDIEPRRQLNGKWRIVMDEDTLQSILLHYMGTKLSASARTTMRFWLAPILLPSPLVTPTELFRRDVYLRGENTTRSGLQHELDRAYGNDFFLSHLPRSLNDYDAYDDDGASNNGERKSWRELKQNLLQHIATEAKICYHLHGDVAVVQTDLQWFATSIPHGTIYTVLRFLGLSDAVIEFFHKYLRTPLNMGKTSGEYRVQIRQCGMPMTHILENYLGEIVLVFLDIAVQCKADILLYRMHDDIFLCGSTEQCERGWATLKDFVNIAGLEINENKTGSVSINSMVSGVSSTLPLGDVKFDFLKLNADDASWTIDSELVDAHVKQLGKQLNECQSVLSFIRTYNSCIGRFFGYTFGLPAQCFGRKHVQDILATHKRVQAELFGAGGISALLAGKLQRLVRANTNLPPDMKILKSFIFMPLAFGGLGVTNPFIPLLLRDDNMIESVDERIRTFFQTERQKYEEAKADFEKEHVSEREVRYKRLLKSKNLSRTDFEIDLETFMSFEEYTRYREWLSDDFKTLYNDLHARPEVKSIAESQDLLTMSKRLPAEVRDIFDSLNEKEQYLVHLFADELIVNFGGLAIVDRSLVAIGVMKAILSEQVTWQMVL